MKIGKLGFASVILASACGTAQLALFLGLGGLGIGALIGAYHWYLTGAAVAVGKVLPQFVGKLTGNAIRVPTPNVSMAILNLTLGRSTTREEVNEYMRNVALHSPLRKQIDYSNSPEVVSSDFVGSRHACVFDAEATIINGKQAVLYLWYDNEFGYSCQVHRMLEQIAGVQYAVYPQEQ